MKMKIILSAVLVSVLLTACSKYDHGPDGQIVAKDQNYTKVCYDGLVVIRFGHSKYSNGFFYKRNPDNSLVQCSMETK